MLKKGIISVCFLFITTFLQGQTHNLMPVPSRLQWGDQRFELDKNFYVVMNADPLSRAGQAVSRFLRRLDNRTHLFIEKEFCKQSVKGKGQYLVIDYSRVGELKAGEDESYSLNINGDAAHLTAVTDIGVIRGLETFLQLVEYDKNGFFIRGVSITDEPRFTWRGLMIDVSRHFFPVDVIKRNIDGMAMVKLNVLHLHLSDDQGFRIESNTFPLLHQKGSNGEYFTQVQVTEIIQYANERGIRVVPEFDMPGHATSWFAGYPQLAAAPGPYEIEKEFGVFDPVMDPAKKSTYRFLKKFINEMCSLFPDEYFHIGGDENNGKQWDANREIREFMTKKGIKNNHELQNYFNQKIYAILKKNKKKLIGWDEILHPDLPKDALVHSWRGKEGLKEATAQGNRVILSNGYYIDLVQPAWKHYMNDPLPGELKLTDEQARLVLGGEATMWSELITTETIDSRIWPRTAAIAERLWSPAEIRNIPGMYKRLETVSIQLEEAGLQHLKNPGMMIRRLIPGRNIQPFEVLAGLVEPLEEYKRKDQGIFYTTDLPFTRLADIAGPESEEARKFSMLCEKLVKGKDTTLQAEIITLLRKWISNHDALIEAASDHPALKGWITQSKKLKDVATIGIESIEKIKNRDDITDEWVATSHQTLKVAALPVDECELMIVEPVKMLFQYAIPK